MSMQDSPSVSRQSQRWALSVYQFAGCRPLACGAVEYVSGYEESVAIAISEALRQNAEIEQGIDREVLVAPA